MPRQDSSDVTTWTSCSPGTLAELNRRLRATKKRTKVVRVAAPVLVLACFGFGAWAVQQPTMPAEFNFGGVTCTEVQSKMRRYATGQLPAAMQRPLEIHLAKCPQCQLKMKATMGDGGESLVSSAETLRKNNSGEGFAPHRHLLATNIQ